MSDNIVDNVGNDYNELNDNNNFDINNANSLSDDTANELLHSKMVLNCLLGLMIGI